MDVAKTFAFVDLAGFSALTDTHGDDEAIRIVKGFQARAERTLGSGDELVKTIGDAVMLAFADPDAAVVALARLFEAELSSAGTPLLPRAGAHHGPAIQDGDDYIGRTVNVAARVAALAPGGHLLVTAEVAMAARRLGHVITHIGPTTLRNIAEPVDLFDIDMVDDQAESAVDPVCAMRVPTSGERAITLTWDGRRVWFCGLPCVALFAGNPDRYRRGDAIAQ